MGFCLNFIFLSVFVVYCSLAEEQYSNKYDNVDFVAILKDEEKLKGYIMCLLGDGPCTPEGNFLKEVLPDAIATTCKKCNDHQRKFAKISTHFLMKNFPQYWERIENKYDPKGEHKAALMAFIQEKEI